MPDTFTPPDPVALLRAYLNQTRQAAGDSARAFGSVPNPRPDRFIRLMQTGARRSNLVTLDAQVTVECWETTEALALGLASAVYSDISTFNTIAAWTPQGEDGWIGGPYTDQDPESRAPRAVMTCTIRMPL